MNTTDEWTCNSATAEADRQYPLDMTADYARSAEGHRAAIMRRVRHLRWWAFITGDPRARYEIAELEREL